MTSIDKVRPFEFFSLLGWKSELANTGDMFASSGSSARSCRGVQYRLELPREVVIHTVNQGVTVV